MVKDMMENYKIEDFKMEEYTMDGLEKEILMIAGGQDEYHYPNSASGIIIYNLEKDEALECFVPAPIEMFSSKDAVTCVFDFKKNQEKNFQESMDICSSWLIEPKDNGLFLSVIPLLLDANCSILCYDLNYADYYELENGTKRLILCFGTHHILQTEGLDVAAFEEEVHKEYREMVKGLDQKIAEMEERVSELEAVEDHFGYKPDLDFEDQEEDTDNKLDNNRVRFVREDEDETV